jgi:hypothetical protein
MGRVNRPRETFRTPPRRGTFFRIGRTGERIGRGGYGGQRGPGLGTLTARRLAE